MDNNNFLKLEIDDNIGEKKMKIKNDRKNQKIKRIIEFI